MIQLRFVILGIAALAFVPLSAVAQSPAQPGVKAGEQAEGEPTTRSNHAEPEYQSVLDALSREHDAYQREHDRASKNASEAAKWQNQEMMMEREVQNLQMQLNYERNENRQRPPRRPGPPRPGESDDD
jgi:Skp family chaperone for outer membrane proteins